MVHLTENDTKYRTMYYLDIFQFQQKGEKRIIWKFVHQ